MTIRLIRRLAISSAAALGCLAGFMVPAAHADTLPGNTPSLPFPAAVYSNGCSFPGPNLLFDFQVFPDPSPWAFPYAFPVYFRPACDLHDSGYSGGIVFDSINGGVINTVGLSRLTIDNKFYGDLITLCNRSIPGYAPVARAACYTVAAAYYWAVRGVGSSFFDASPAIPGRQALGTRPNN